MEIATALQHYMNHNAQSGKALTGNLEARTSERKIDKFNSYRSIKPFALSCSTIIIIHQKMLISILLPHFALMLPEKKET
jgi:hypothetical protein